MDKGGVCPGRSESPSSEVLESDAPDQVDRRLVLWATRQLAPFRAPVLVAPVAAGLPPLGAVPFYAAPAASAVKNYTLQWSMTRFGVHVH
eukprot:scaffold12890_cov52-Attheya_sp.AAC.2